jgi:hypothetical protein
VVQQAHEIQCIAKELELLKCALPDMFVVGCIIAKLPLHGGTSPQLSNTRDMRYQLKI